MGTPRDRHAVYHLFRVGSWGRPVIAITSRGLVAVATVLIDLDLQFPHAVGRGRNVLRQRINAGPQREDEIFNPFQVGGTETQ